jgi:hypothetical protein
MAASGAYASALTDLRDTVKWIMAAFTGAGAIIFSGLTITNISKLAENGQWIFPVVLAGVPLIAAIAAIAAALRVINAMPPSVGSLFSGYAEALTTAELRKITDQQPAVTSQQPEKPTSAGRKRKSGDKRSLALARELPNAIGVYGTKTEFDARLVEALKRVKRTRDLNDGDLGRQAAYEAALTTLDGLQATVKDALDCATYIEARTRFRFFAWCVVIAGLVSFGALIASGIVTGDSLSSQQAASAKAAKAAPPVSVSFTQPTPVQVWLTVSQPAKAGGSHDCPLWNGMPAIAVGGTPGEPVLLFPGYTNAAARKHGISSPPAGCTDPWLWTTNVGEVLVVPQ